MRLLLFLSLATLCSCSQSNSGTRPNPEEIEWSLSLLALDRTPHNFVIFEHAQTKKFVQFAWDGESLQLDLPIQPLIPDYIEPARNFFQTHNVSLEEWTVYEYDGGPEAGAQSSFQMYFGKDYKRAALVAMEVFARIYGYEENFPLSIRDGS